MTIQSLTSEQMATLHRINQRLRNEDNTIRPRDERTTTSGNTGTPGSYITIGTDTRTPTEAWWAPTYDTPEEAHIHSHPVGFAEMLVDERHRAEEGPDTGAPIELDASGAQHNRLRFASTMEDDW